MQAHPECSPLCALMSMLGHVAPTPPRLPVHQRDRDTLSVQVVPSSIRETP